MTLGGFFFPRRGASSGLGFEVEGWVRVLKFTLDLLVLLDWVSVWEVERR